MGAVDIEARRQIAELRAQVEALSGQAPPAAVVPPRGVGRVLHLVAAEFGVPVEELTGEARRPEVAHPRQVAMALAHRVCGFSTLRIGAVLRRDHTTVLHGVRAALARAEADQDLAARMDRLAQQLRSNGGTA